MNEEQTQKKLHGMVRELLAKYCDECGHAYESDDMRILQSNKSNILVHLSCKNCGKTHMAHIVQSLGISNRTPIKTDLRPDEISKFAGSKAVSADDVLDIYEWTKKAEKTRNSKHLKELLS